MEGRTCPREMTREELQEAERLFEETKEAAGEEMWRMCCMIAGKQDHELFGENEFEMRDILMRLGARALEKAANSRRKKGAT